MKKKHHGQVWARAYLNGLSREAQDAYRGARMARDNGMYGDEALAFALRHCDPFAQEVESL